MACRQACVGFSETRAARVTSCGITTAKNHCTACNRIFFVRPAQRRTGLDRSGTRNFAEGPSAASVSTIPLAGANGAKTRQSDIYVAYTDILNDLQTTLPACTSI